MRIIERYEPIAYKTITWTYVQECPECKTVFVIDKSDIKITWNKHFGKYQLGIPDCPVCDEKFTKRFGVDDFQNPRQYQIILDKKTQFRKFTEDFWIGLFLLFVLMAIYLGYTTG